MLLLTLADDQRHQKSNNDSLHVVSLFARSPIFIWMEGKSTLHMFEWKHSHRPHIKSQAVPYLVKCAAGAERSWVCAVLPRLSPFYLDVLVQSMKTQCLLNLSLRLFTMFTDTNTRWQGWENPPSLNWLSKHRCFILRLCKIEPYAI